MWNGNGNGLDDKFFASLRFGARKKPWVKGNKSVSLKLNIRSKLGLNMRKTLALIVLVLFCLPQLRCMDKESLRYFMRGTLLTAIKESRTLLSLENAPRSAICFDKDGDGDQDLFVITEDDLVLVYENLIGGRLASPPLAYIIERTPQRMAVADFNGDKFLDIAISNQLSDDVTVLLNSSAGQFYNMFSFDAGAEPFAIVAEDFDKDGAVDLAVASLTDNLVRIYANQKSEQFESKVSKPTGTLPFDMATSDVDKNGYPDLLVVNQESNDVSVFRNMGDFNFLDEEIYPVGDKPTAITTLDFNGDHFYDAAIARFAADTLAVLLNNGKGEFEQMLQFRTGKSPVALAAIDLDFNGWEDLIVANADEDSLSFFMNSPGYLDKFKYFLQAGFHSSFLTVGLLNDNKFLDLVVCDFQDKKILILFDVIAPREI